MKRSLDDLKSELVGKVYGLFTILDVVIDDNKAKCVCRCKCGNIRLIMPCIITKGRISSCGCIRQSKEYRNKMSNKSKEWANNHPEKVKEISSKIKQYYNDNPDKRVQVGINTSNWAKNNPDKIAEKAAKFSEWCKANQDKLEARSIKYKEWCKQNPNSIQEIGNKISEWCKNNPDKVIARTEKIKQYYKDHPDVITNIANKCKQWYNDNTDIVHEMVEKRLQTFQNNSDIQDTINKKRIQWYKDNPDKVKLISEKISSTFKQKRINNDFTLLLNKVHPDYIQPLLNGDINSLSEILIKCPICGEYDKHSFHNIFRINSNDIKPNSHNLCHKCYANISQSSPELEIKDIINTMYNGKCIENSRSIIPPLELDLYYPEKNVAIEFNGNYWHDENHKPKDYHFNKFKLCKDKNIRLVSIYESDWYNKRDNIISLLKNIFIDSKIIYARNCTISKLDYKTKSDFINEYHFYCDSNQGNISYGLYYNDELVSVMSFGKLRGQNKLHNNKDHYELVRFVTKDSMRIIGGASKLFKKFISEYHPVYIICYSDNDFFTGETYNKLGFKLKSLGESIDYQWVKGTKALSRYECMASKLLEKYPKYRNINIIGSIEDYIMHDLGYSKLYRCGNSIWEYKQE